MEKVTVEILLWVSASRLRAFREAGAFIRVDSEMRRLLAYFDKHGMVLNSGNLFMNKKW